VALIGGEHRVNYTKWNWICVCMYRVCTASADGQLCIWDSVSLLRLNRIQVDVDDRSLFSLMVHRDHLLCCMCALLVNAHKNTSSCNDW